MKLELCCIAMGKSFKNETIVVDTKNSCDSNDNFILVLPTIRYKGLKNCPFCGDQIEIICKEDIAE